MILKIISGGQTGVDRGALDAALACGVPCGGWCPEGRKAEDGVIPARYPVTELAGGDYGARTLKNVVDADATVMIYFEKRMGGTLETQKACIHHHKPYLCIDATQHSPDQAAAKINTFYNASKAKVLNIAGPRSSAASRAQRYAEAAMTAFIKTSL